jgi:hypothetical protein
MSLSSFVRIILRKILYEYLHSAQRRSLFIISLLLLCTVTYKTAGINLGKIHQEFLIRMYDYCNFIAPRLNNMMRSKHASFIDPISCCGQKSNMPLVHFGDTSYEKYIFGGQGKLLQNDKKTAIASENPTIEDSSKNFGSNEADVKTDRWHSSDKIRENGLVSSTDICTAKDSYTDMNLEKVVDHNNKYKGTHKTTVNFLSDENNAVPKVNEGTRFFLFLFLLFNFT